MRIKLPSFNIEVKPIQLDSVSDFIIKIAILFIIPGMWKMCELFSLFSNYINKVIG